MNEFRLDTPIVRDREHAVRLSEAGRAAVAVAQETVGQPRAPLGDRDLRKLLATYERGAKDLRTGADEVMLYRHDLDRKVAFTRATLPGLEQYLRGLQVALGIAPPATPPRRWA